MKRSAFVLTAVSVAALLLLAGTVPAAAQDGTIKVNVKPKTGYVLVDGRPIGQGSQTVRVAPGDHRVQVIRYGRQPFEQSVTVAAGERQNLDVNLAPVGGTVTGPWGRIRLFVNPNRAAIFLNGRTPEFLIGCVGATDGNFLGKQELLVRPGTHQVTIALDGYRTYTGSVTVAENEEVHVRFNLAAGSGEEAIPATAISRKTENYLANIGTTERERTAMIGMRAAIAPLSAQFAADPTSLRCGQSARLTWSTEEGRQVEISGVGQVAASGEQLVAPKQTTTYTLRAAGPGGVDSASATVNVDASIRATFNVSPAAIAIETLDGQETKRENATLTWSVENATTVEISGLGTVSASGSRQVSPDQNTTYTLRATNECGTVESSSAALAVNRTDLKTPEVQLASIFFPTDYPDARNPSVGLVASQGRIVELLAQGFAEYLKARPNGRLRLEANADERRSVDYNRELSQRRGNLIKQRLADAGIPAANVEVVARGEEQPLPMPQVTSLEEKNPNQAPRARMRNRRGNWLAYNRRVDIVLSPTGGSSERYYPHQAADSDILWRVPKPSLSAVRRASQP
ncbi:MAG: OmpA family protein [Acidobacteria bacterium]|nr:OmpA family protein [Acidobacteriota bacterium]